MSNLFNKSMRFSSENATEKHFAYNLFYFLRPVSFVYNIFCSFLGLFNLSTVTVSERYIEEPKAMDLPMTPPSPPKMPEITTFVFFDIETTSLPHLERNQTKIIEMSFVASLRKDIETTPVGEMPTIKKLTFCLNPNRPVARIVTKMTGLSRRSLEKHETFIHRLKSVIDFLQALQPPVCLVAHNGDLFDYKILLAELHDVNARLPQDLLCVDSLKGFRAILRSSSTNSSKIIKEISLTPPMSQPQPYLDMNDLMTDDDEEFPDLDLSAEDWAQLDSIDKNPPVKKPRKTQKKARSSTEKVVKVKTGNTRRVLKEKTNNSNTESFKLTDIYKRLLNREDINAHRAEGDCLMLLLCVGAVKEKFLPWSDENCQLLNKIQPLRRY